MTKELVLSNGIVSFVDEEDFEFLSQWKWFPSKGGYARRKDSLNGKRITKLLHRVIMNAPEGMLVDHINGNKLDNRKSNLRLCDRSKNAFNRKNNFNNPTGYKGVDLVPTGRFKKKYRARIGKDKKLFHLGYFNTPEEAAKAYNEAAKKYHGEFANLNEL